MEVRYRYRLRVSRQQAVALDQVYATNRFVWNQMVGRWNDLWRHEGESCFERDMHRELTDLRSRFEWLDACPVTPQQQVIRDLGKAIRGFFDPTSPARRPRYRSKRRPVTSARWTTRGFRVDRGRLCVAVAGGRIKLRVVWSRALPSEPKSVTVCRDPAGRWFASFVVRIEPDERVHTGRSTGADVGLTTFVTTVDPDHDIPNPRFARRAARDLAQANRALARTEKESKGRERARQRLAKVHARTADRRRDHHHKTARDLARAFDVIGIEDLRVANMVRNRHLARSIADAGWAEWATILEHQARKAGSTVVRMDARNTTQTCSGCGTKAKVRLGLKDRVFCCQSCGLVMDRDRNAARNLDPGRTEPGESDDGSKTIVPVGTAAA
jgi:putative transposase